MLCTNSPIGLIPNDCIFVDTNNVEPYSVQVREPMAKTLQEELKKRHGFASPQQEAYLNLARTYAQLSGAVAEVLKPSGGRGVAQHQRRA